MTAVSIIDSGPIVAFLSAADKHHQWAAATFDALEGRIITCEAVLSEASFIVARKGHRHAVVLELVERMKIVVPSLGSELRALRTLVSKYSSIPMSFADACLVRLSELHAEGVVVTCDSDFLTYRRNNRRIVETLMPE